MEQPNLNLIQFNFKFPSLLTQKSDIKQQNRIRHSPLECLQPHITRNQSKIPSRNTHFTVFQNVPRFFLSLKIKHEIWAEDIVNYLHRTVWWTRRRCIYNPFLLIQIHWHCILCILPPPEKTHTRIKSSIIHQCSSQFEHSINFFKSIHTNSNQSKSKWITKVKSFD